MKKIIIISILVLITGIITLFICYHIEALTYSPIKDKEAKILFQDIESIKKKCSVDYIGLSLHGEIFEIYLYKTKNVSLGENYPNYANEWENQPITNETILSKWKRCPLDSVSVDICNFILTTNQFDKKKCVSPVRTELYNSDNYYSYVDFGNFEQYFLLFCTKTGLLYYIRMHL
jgi:hypothetical protein